MALFKRKNRDITEKRDDNTGFRPDDPAADLARAFGLNEAMTFEKAMQLPPVSASIDFISSICARVPIKLYRESIEGDETRTEEVTDDIRTELLNGSTGDSLNAYQMKKAWVTDYFGEGQGYIFIDKYFGAWRSLRYVEQVNITINVNNDPIFKDADIFIADRKYFYWDFLRLCRDTKDGFKGRSIIDTNGELITLMYKTMRFEKKLMDTGGNKKGFLKAANKLTDKAMSDIKAAWRDLYSVNDNNNVMVLNNGLDYKDTSATSTELQLNENKLTNNDLLTMIFLLSAKALQGASDDDIVSAVKTAVIPIIEQMEQAFNEGLLLESEKKTMYWACDTSALERGDILKRFQAYKLAIEGNFMQADEIRYKEDMPALGLNWIRLGLDDVLYDPKTKTIYTPNTNASVKVGEGGIAVGDEQKRYSPDQPREENGRFTFGNGRHSSLSMHHHDQKSDKDNGEYEDHSSGEYGGRKNNSAKFSEAVDKSAGNGIIETEDIIIGKSLGAKAHNYKVTDPVTEEEFKFVEGTRIHNPTVFAGKDGVKPLKDDVKEGLAKQYGGKPENWQHAKGIGTIDYYGEAVKAEVHWFQEETAGKHGFKVKEWLFDES